MTMSQPTPTRQAVRPAGWIYLVHTVADATKYIGQTSQPVPSRINQHRRALTDGGQTWGHTILPGRQGYTILRRVESLGHPVLDAIALDLAEAEEILRWTPTENTNRPNPQVFRDRLAARMGRPLPPVPTARPGVARVPQTPVAVRVPTLPWRKLGWIVLGCVWAYVAWWFATTAVANGLPWAWAPWAFVPAAAVIGPALTVRFVTHKPRRRRRTRRRR